MKYNFNKSINRNKTCSFKWDHRKSVFGTNDILPMNVADMDLAIPKPVQKALKKRLKHPVLGYTMRTDTFFDAVRYWSKKRYHWHVKNEWIYPIQSIVPAISHAIQVLTKPGDGVLIQPPVYNPFSELIEYNDRKVICNDLIVDKNDHPHKVYYTINFDDFEEKVKQAKLFLLCSPHNPVGRVWTHIELEKMGNICKKYGVKIFSDEAHSDLVFKKYKHIPISSLNDFKDISVTVMSPSKSFNVGGLSTSVMIIPNGDIREKFENIMRKSGVLMTFGVCFSNVFGLLALETCYTKCEVWLDELLEHLEDNKKFIQNFIENDLSMLKMSDSESLYMAWIDFNKLGMKQDDLIDFMKKKAKLGLDTGTKFGVNGQGFMRLNYACSRKVLEKALQQMKKAINKTFSA